MGLTRSQRSRRFHSAPQHEHNLFALIRTSRAPDGQSEWSQPIVRANHNSAPAAKEEGRVASIGCSQPHFRRRERKRSQVASHSRGFCGPYIEIETIFAPGNVWQPAGGKLGHVRACSGCVTGWFLYGSLDRAGHQLERGILAFQIGNPMNAWVTTDGYATNGCFNATDPPSGFVCGNVLQYECTQRWTAMAAIKMFSKPPEANIFFTNVLAGKPYSGYEFWVDWNGFLHVRIINNIANNYIGKVGTTKVYDAAWQLCCGNL